MVPLILNCMIEKLEIDTTEMKSINVNNQSLEYDLIAGLCYYLLLPGTMDISAHGAQAPVWCSYKSKIACFITF